MPTAASVPSWTLAEVAFVDELMLLDDPRSAMASRRVGSDVVTDRCDRSYNAWMEFDDLSDAELLVCSRESPAAFGVFYRRHAREVQSYFRRRVETVEIAFDLTAETFAAALRGVPRYEPRPEPARAWLFGIARNVLLESGRRGRVQDRARKALEMQPIVLDEVDVESLELLADTPAVEAVEKLPADQRAAVLAYHVDGESYAEMAKRLECSESVIRQRVSRGLRTLRTRLEEWSVMAPRRRWNGSAANSKPQRNARSPRRQRCRAAALAVARGGAAAHSGCWSRSWGSGSARAAWAATATALERLAGAVRVRRAGGGRG